MDEYLWKTENNFGTNLFINTTKPLVEYNIEINRIIASNGARDKDFLKCYLFPHKKIYFS